MNENENHGDARIQTGDAVDSLTASTAKQRAPHTPGPWRVRESQHGGGIIERASNAHAQSHVQIVPLADAYLMAAAPDLLAACEQLATAVVQHGLTEEDAPERLARFQDVMTALRAADAAIAKAEGR